MIGLILSLKTIFINLAKITPEAVAMQKAPAPSANILIESGVRNRLASVEAPTVNPNTMVTISMKAVRAVEANRSVTAHSFSKLPKNKKPRRFIEPGAIKPVIIKANIGNRILNRRLTGLDGFIFISRSFFVVSSLIIGG